MSPLVALLLGGVARAEPVPADDSAPAAADPLYTELLGDAPAAQTATPVAAVPGLGTWVGGLWPLGLAAIGAGLVWVAKKRGLAPGGASSDGPWIVGRTPLVGGGALVLVDLRDASGRARRLLVGTGPGAPTLLADLGDDDASGAEDAERAEPREPTAVHGPAFGPVAVGRVPFPVNEPAPPPRPRGRVSTSVGPGRSLFDEVVGARRSDPPESVRRPDAPGGRR